MKENAYLCLYTVEGTAQTNRSDMLPCWIKEQKEEKEVQHSYF